MLLVLSKWRLLTAIIIVGVVTLLFARLVPAGPPLTIITRVPTSSRAVALSFDDGPSTRYTPAILSLLSRYHAHATFFVLGKAAARHPKLLQEISAQGSEIGLHGFSHRAFTALSPTQLAQELADTNRVVREATGRVPTLVRPPYGLINNRVLSELATLNYQAVTWNNDSRDWARPGIQGILHNIRHNLRSGDILIFHDYGEGDLSQTLQALQVLLPEFTANGYRCLTVSQLMRSH